MSLSIRHWLAERQIDLRQLGGSIPQVAGVAFRIVQEIEAKSLTPFDVSPITEILELPLEAAQKLALPISQVTVGVLRALSRKKPLKRAEGTWLTFQIAYLNALHMILEQETELKRPWLDRARIPWAGAKDLPLVDQKLQALLKTLRTTRLSDLEAEQALNLAAESLLVKQLRGLNEVWLVVNGAESVEARLLVQRLIHGLPGHLLAAVVENALPLAQLQKFVRLGNFVDASVGRATAGSVLSVVENTLIAPPTGTVTINLEREYYRASLLQAVSEPMLGELFALKDLYIPLKGQEIKETGAKAPPAPINLMEWAIAQLDDTEAIAAIEAPPGGGKTSFCQMLAARVAQELYPRWMPVPINLRDATLGQTLEQTLASAFPLGRCDRADGWLSPTHPPCLLLLDGLDELFPPHQPQTERGLNIFLSQLERFQTPGKFRHKVILTSSSFQSRDWNLATKDLLADLVHWRRIIIQPMAQEEFQQWFKQWTNLQSKSIAHGYFAFLKQGGAFRALPRTKELADLVTQPLMLYLLGILHRNGLLEDSIFQLADSQVKWEIFDRICRWLLGEGITNSAPLLEVREGFAHVCRSLEAIANLLQERSPQQVRQQMQKEALQILQTGGYQRKLDLKSESLAISLPDLPVFFFKVSSSLEFSHPKLGEYLGAEAIAAQLKAITTQVNDRYGAKSFAIDSPIQVAEHLYHLLGYGLLSPDIEELVLERLRREELRHSVSFSFTILFQRLEHFYRFYCQGRWLDEGLVSSVRTHQQALSNSLNTLQIDAAVGLNVFLLLCAIAKETQIPFFPCSDPNFFQEFDPHRLLAFIGRTVALSPTAFWQRSRHSLSQMQLAGACLNRLMLAEANLWQANLSGAELIGINLVNANLQEANLSWANLTDANLYGATFTGARLDGANLTRANLLMTNLKFVSLANACLFEAQIDEENKKIAQENGAIFSWEEFQSYRQTSPVTLVGNLSDPSLLITQTSSHLLIESAEGEPILPDDTENASTSAMTNYEDIIPSSKLGRNFDDDNSNDTEFLDS